MEEKNLRCCFAGHSDISGDEIYEKVKNIAQELITKNGVTEFWVGFYGNFDRRCASVISELKKTYKDIKLELVIPYMKKEIQDFKEEFEKEYDNILIADVPENTPKKFYISKTNEYMVDKSQFIICDIERSWGGAFTTFQYAKRKELKVFNVAKNPI